MSPRPDVSEERRNQILEAAMAVFARQGFDQTRMDDIAQEAGLSKGALYLYYKSKDTIISTILQFFFTQAMNKLSSFLESEEQLSVRQRLFSLNRYYMQEMKWMTSLVPLSFEFYAVAARQKTVRHFLKQYFKDYRVALTQLIQHGIEQGEFRPIEPEQVAISITALYEGLALLWLVDPDATTWEQTGATSLTILLDGITAR